MSKPAGRCAKKHVTCILRGTDGMEYLGTNFCLNPQETCPREPGEGYEKCSTICEQVGHAEEVALSMAGDRAKGATAHVSGIGWACRNCQEQLYGAGVISIAIE